MRHRTREAWLQAVVSVLRPKFRAAGYTLPRKVAVSCGWPSAGGTNVAPNTKEAECWTTKASPEGINQIFISPVLADELHIAGALVHELLHAALDEADHGARYRRGMAALGLVGDPSRAHPNRALRGELAELVKPLGLYPHMGLKP